MDVFFAHISGKFKGLRRRYALLPPAPFPPQRIVAYNTVKTQVWRPGSSKNIGLAHMGGQKTQPNRRKKLVAKLKPRILRVQISCCCSKHRKIRGLAPWEALRLTWAHLEPTCLQHGHKKVPKSAPRGLEEPLGLHLALPSGLQALLGLHLAFQTGLQVPLGLHLAVQTGLQAPLGRHPSLTKCYKNLTERCTVVKF